jgi:hypothetical protein
MQSRRMFAGQALIDNSKAVISFSSASYDGRSRVINGKRNLESLLLIGMRCSSL